MGSAGESRMTAHQAKKLDVDALKAYRDRCALPLTDAEVEALAFIKPAAGGHGGRHGARYSASGFGFDLLPWPEPDYSKFGPIEPVEQSRIQKLSAVNLARNWVTILHVTSFDKADLTGTEAFRKELNAHQGGESVKVTLLAVMIKAPVSALKAYPRFNVSFSGGRIIQKKLLQYRICRGHAERLGGRPH